jgi:hypothetical protein
MPSPMMKLMLRKRFTLFHKMRNSFAISAFLGKIVESTDVSDKQVTLYFTDGSMMKFTALPVGSDGVGYHSAELEVQTIDTN